MGALLLLAAALLLAGAVVYLQTRDRYRFNASRVNRPEPPSNQEFIRAFDRVKELTPTWDISAADSSNISLSSRTSDGFLIRLSVCEYETDHDDIVGYEQDHTLLVKQGATIIHDFKFHVGTEAAMIGDYCRRAAASVLAAKESVEREARTAQLNTERTERAKLDEIKRTFYTGSQGRDI